jgi:hypothetical protein
MSFITTDCCICFETSKKYTQKKTESKCEHPVCALCFKEMIEKECFQEKKIPCPLCRVDIESPEIEIASAIDRIETIRYECIYDPAIDICDEMIFLDEEIIFVTYEDIEIEKTSKKNQVKKFNYMNKIIPKNRNRNIVKFHRNRY